MKFTVKWEVDYDSKDLKLYCDIDEDEDNVITLDDIFNFLNEGLEEGFKFTPENNVEFHDANFNIEYVIILMKMVRNYTEILIIQHMRINKNSNLLILFVNKINQFLNSLKLLPS
tara:strand:- start:2541 stop:2885 length:345 start_codon:yes stop_codon:yes gene_type:complete